MLEQLFNLVKDHSQDAIINNPAIPNEQNNQAVGAATESIFSGLQGALANGGIGSIMSLLGGQSSVSGSNPLVGGIIQNLEGSLMSKLGVTGPVAQNVAASLIPKVLGGLVHQTSDPNNSGFNINGIISSLMGGGGTTAGSAAPIQANGQTVDLNQALNSITGGQAVQAPTTATAHDASGGFGMDDILKMVTGGNAAGGGGAIQSILQAVTGGAQQQQQQQQGGGIMNLLKGFMG